MNKFTIDYEGKQIEFNGLLFTYDGKYSNADITKVQEYIDREIKSNFKRFEVWNHRGDTVTLTSHPDPNIYWGSCNGNRSKYESYRGSGFNLYVKNESNAVAVEKIKSLNESLSGLEAQASEIRKEQQRLVQSMERLSEQEAK